MQRLFGLTCILVAVHGITVTNHVPEITFGHHIESHRRYVTSAAPKDLPNAMNRTMELHFTTNKHEFSLNLHLFEGLYSRNAVIQTGDRHGNPVRLQPQFRSFHGQAVVSYVRTGERQFGRCSVTFYRNDRFHAVVVTPQEVYTVDLNDEQIKFPLHGRDNGHGMHVIPDSARKHDRSYLDIVQEMVERFASRHPVARAFRRSSAHKQPSSTDTYFNDFYAPSSSDEARSTFRMAANSPTGSHGQSSARKLQQLVTFDQCYPNQGQNVISLRMGVVTDAAFYTRIYQLSSIQNDADVQTWIESVLTDATAIIYTPQLNVFLQLSVLMMGSTTANMLFDNSQIPCTATASARLAELRKWRAAWYTANTDTVGLWHLLTNCHPPAGTVGIAYLGVICSRSNGYGTGLTNYLGSGTWKTFSHEVGHNFDASHSFDNGQGATGGIMDYGPGYYPLTPVSARVYQFNPLRKVQVCLEIERSLRIANCWQPFPPPNGAYQWEATGKWDDSLCTPCDSSNRFQSATYDCYQISPSKVKVNTAYCETLSHLVPHTKPCPGCTPNVVCGDNTVELGEICDDSTNCCNNCKTITPSVACLSKYSFTDGAFIDQQGKAYILQGNYYSRYSAFSNYPTPDEGYPKAINSSAVFKSQWLMGSPITAVASKPDGEVYVFFGLNYMIRDMAGSTITRPGQTGNVSIDFALPHDFTACGKVQAAITVESSYFLFFCEWLYLIVPFTRTASDVHPLSSESVMNLGIAEHKLPVSAGFMDRDGTFYYFQGNKVTGVRARQTMAGYPRGAASVFTNSKALQSLQLPKQLCTDPNCATCSTSPDICTSCEPLFVLHGLLCYDQMIMAWVTFDLGSTQDKVFVKNDALGQYASGNTQSTNLYFQPGVRNESFVMRSSLHIPLAPLGLDKNPVTAFEVSMWYKPAGVHNGTWFEMDNQVRVDLQQKTNMSFALTLVVNEQPFDCFVSAPVTVGQWNKIEVRLENGVFWTGANGIFHRRATIVYGGANTLVALPLNSWTIGSVTRPSIAGQIDDFAFRRLDGGKSSTGGNSAAVSKTPEPLSSAAIGGIVGAALFLVLICCGFALYQFYCVPTYGGCPACPTCCEKTEKRTSMVTQSKAPAYVVAAEGETGGGLPQPPPAVPPPVPGASANPFAAVRPPPPGMSAPTGGAPAPPRRPGRPKPPNVPSYVR